MTEREIPDGVGFLFGGMTDRSISQSAPPVLSEPENRLAASSAPSGAPVYASRREARDAAAAPVTAAPAVASPIVDAPQLRDVAVAPQPATPEAPAYDGIASLFPLLGEVTSSPLTTELAAPSAFEALLAPPPADLGATQAISTADVAVELATPVAPYVVPKTGPVPVAPSWHAADAAVALPAAAATPAATSAAAFGSTPAPADPFVTARRQHAAPVNPAGRPRRATRRSTAPRAPRTPYRAAPNPDVGPKPLRQRIFGIGVMMAVGGLFAVLAIPAYAENDASALHSAAVVQTQKVAVANAAASTIKSQARDGYSATSAADLKSMYAAAMREQNIAAYLQSGAKAKGDDYPWFAELDRAQGGGLSPLGYYYRECVDFVAWRLNRDAGTTSAPFKWTWSKLTPNGGDGHQWKAAWLSHGWATGATPVPGAVAWFGNNHVGYVNGILDNGQVLIEEYNYTPHAYSTRVINASQAYYLYAPPK